MNSPGDVVQSENIVVEDMKYAFHSLERVIELLGKSCLRTQRLQGTFQSLQHGKVLTQDQGKLVIPVTSGQTSLLFSSGLKPV